MVRSTDDHANLARQTRSAGRDVRAEWDELRGVIKWRTDAALSVRRQRSRDPTGATGTRRRHLAWLRVRRGGGPGLRFSGRWRLRPLPGPALQPRQAAP